MSALLTPLAVLYACQGCAEFGQIARDAGAALERDGSVEMVWLGAGRNLKPKRQRYPIVALDGCAKACARTWLEQQGVKPDRSCVVDD